MTHGRWLRALGNGCFRHPARVKVWGVPPWARWEPVASLQKVHEMLKKGWDTEGSPFRGQKFDPSMFNISPGAVQF